MSVAAPTRWLMGIRWSTFLHLMSDPVAGLDGVVVDERPHHAVLGQVERVVMCRDHIGRAAGHGRKQRVLQGEGRPVLATKGVGFDATVQLVECSLSGEERGAFHACHPVHVLEVAERRIAADAVFCGGRWPASLLAEMAKVRRALV